MTVTSAVMAKMNQFDLIESATNAIDANNHKQAIKYLEKLTTQNPLHGEYWYQLGSAQLSSGNHSQAIVSFKAAAKIGYQKAYASYNVAACYALLKQAEPAIEWLIKARQLKMPDFEQSVLSDSDFDAVRRSNIYKKLIYPQLPQQATRAEKWHADIDFFSLRLQETHYQLFAHITQANWESEIARIKQLTHSMPDHLIYLELLKLLSHVKDGHSFIVPPLGGMAHFHMLDLRFTQFSDGIFVVAAKPQFQHLVGRKVIAINDVKVEQVLTQLKVLFQGDNRFGAREMHIRWLMTIPEILRGLGIGKHLDQVTITFADRQIVTVQGSLIEPKRFSYIENPADWVGMGKGALWQQKPETNYWFKLLDDVNLGYIKFNRVRSDKHNPLDSFFETVIKRSIKRSIKKGVKALVIDLRSNNGGNGMLNRNFVNALVRSPYNYRGKLFVLIGPRTFSAAHQLALDIEKYTQAIFVGEPTGSSLVYRGESNMVLLPNTGLAVTVASRQFQQDLSDDYRTALTPQVLIKMSSEDFSREVDPVLEAVLNQINR